MAEDSSLEKVNKKCSHKYSPTACIRTVLVSQISLQVPSSFSSCNSVCSPGVHGSLPGLHGQLILVTYPETIGCGKISRPSLASASVNGDLDIWCKANGCVK